MGSDWDRTVSSGTYLEVEDTILYAADARRLRRNESSSQKTRSQRLSERSGCIYEAAMSADHFETHVQQQLSHRNQQNDEVVMGMVARRWGDDVRGKSSLKQMVKRVEKEQGEWVNDPNAVYQAPESSEDEDVPQAPWQRIIGSRRDHKMVKERVEEAKERQKRKSWGGGICLDITSTSKSFEQTSLSAPGTRHHSARQLNRADDDVDEDDDQLLLPSPSQPASSSIPQPCPDADTAAGPPPASSSPPQAQEQSALPDETQAAGSTAGREDEAPPGEACEGLGSEEGGSEEGGSEEGSEEEGSEEEGSDADDNHDARSCHRTLSSYADKRHSFAFASAFAYVRSQLNDYQSQQQYPWQPLSQQQVGDSGAAAKAEPAHSQPPAPQHQAPAAAAAAAAALAPGSLPAANPATSPPLLLQPSPPAVPPSHAVRTSGFSLHVSPASSSDAIVAPFQARSVPSRLTVTAAPPSRKVNFPSEPPDAKLKALGFGGAIRRKVLLGEGDAQQPNSCPLLTCFERASSAASTRKFSYPDELVIGSPHDGAEPQVETPSCGQEHSPGQASPLPLLHAPPFAADVVRSTEMSLSRRASCPGQDFSSSPVTPSAGGGGGASDLQLDRVMGALSSNARRHAALLHSSRATAAAAGAGAGAGGPAAAGGGAAASAWQTRCRRQIQMTTMPALPAMQPAPGGSRLRAAVQIGTPRSSEPGSLLSSYVLRPRLPLADASQHAATAGAAAGGLVPHAPTADKYQLPVLPSAPRVPRISVG